MAEQRFCSDIVQILDLVTISRVLDFSSKVRPDSSAVEQHFCKVKVVGSNPTAGSQKRLTRGGGGVL